MDFMKQRSLFDVISPIMTGPSSSHTAGAVRLGLLAKNIYDATPKKITFKLNGKKYVVKTNKKGIAQKILKKN